MIIFPVLLTVFVFWIFFFMFHTNFSSPALSFHFYYFELFITDWSCAAVTPHSNIFFSEHTSFESPINQASYNSTWNCIASCNVEIPIFTTWCITMQILSRSSHTNFSMNLLSLDECNFRYLLRSTSLSPSPPGSVLEQKGPKADFTS